MLVTIILTCYKQEKFIEETILSVINQKYKNRELLIGDDSYDDNCRKIISRYVKKYPDKIKARHHHPNKGIVKNMQFLLSQRNTKSEYVAFLEGDDCLFPEYLERKLEVFNKYTNVQLVYNELTTIDDKGKVIEKKHIKNCGIKFCKKGKISYEKLVDQFRYKSRSSLMVRSGVICKYSLFSENLGIRTYISDIYFFNQIAHNEDIYGIEEPLVYYRKNNNSVSGNIQGNIKIYFEIIKYIDCLFEQGLIDYRFYKNQTCKNYLLISVVLVKKCLSIGVFRTIKIFSIECIKAIKNRFIRMFN